MRSITLTAPAKVNLTLEVLGRRDDGYHDIASVMQTIDLHDTVTLEDADEVALRCDRPELETTDNLALKAASALKDATGSGRGARITLEKQIPVAAGLGGGSSDAAAVLKGLDRLWSLGLPSDELNAIAKRLGSDVPFFLQSGTAMVQGRGERVRPLPAADLEWLVVVSPRIHVSEKTGTLYSMLSPANYTRGMLTRKLEARIRGGGDVPAQFLFNAFDDVARDAFPGLDECWSTFESLGAQEIHLAGSGPSLYALVPTKEQGTAISLILGCRHGWDAYLVSPTQSGKAVRQ